MFSDENNKRIKLNIIKSILWFSAVIICLLLLYDNNTNLVGYAPNQDVKFSHKTHSEKFEMKCLFCHFTAENSSYSNIPTTYTCMICHIALKNEKESMKKVVDSYYKKTSLSWTRIYYLPEHSRFDHSRHIKSQIDCSTCHGEVEKMDSVYSVKNFTMGWCTDCHKNPENNFIKARNISGIQTDDLPINKYFQTLTEPSTSPFIGGYLQTKNQKDSVYSDSYYNYSNSFNNASLNSLLIVNSHKSYFNRVNIPQSANQNCTVCHY
jgi:hypothetical protein